MIKICIFLTGTIKPPNSSWVARPNYTDRERDYYEAIQTYLKLGLPVTFVENSNTVSDKILKAAEGISNFEYLTFESLKSIKGKGHGEKEIIDYAYENSKNVNNADWVIKITGRYQIDNIEEVIRALETVNADALANFGRNLIWADTRIIFLKKDFYFKYFGPFLEKYLDEENNILFEKVFARSLHQLIADGGKFLPWPKYPFYRGINGANGKQIKFNLYRKNKFRVYYFIKKWVYYQIV